ncbi:MAG: Na+/H+ antiporter NhaA [Candidatus Eremiobacteraeota bacterium]|nr:Na+/H+ antiporter NhaA [Candidatus Eremiobacteraeota bacterium]
MEKSGPPRTPSFYKPAGHWSETHLRHLLTPLGHLVHESRTSGLLLVLATIVTLALANSPVFSDYLALLHREIGLSFGNSSLHFSLLHLINDGLMAVLFFVMGLEIKREFVFGDLSNRRVALLPVFTAFVGAVVPAAIYWALTRGGPGSSGWGIPMATDAAFALGALSLLGKRVPYNLKIFLATVAVVDDVIAIGVIALFYSTGIQWIALLGAAFFVFWLMMGNLWGVRSTPYYGLLGLATWGCFLQSGIHSTIAGVIVAFCIPLRQRMDTGQFLEQAEELLNQLRTLHQNADAHLLGDENQQVAVLELERACEGVQAPLHQMHRATHLLAALGVVPIFAMANMAVKLQLNALNPVAWKVGGGIFFGLFLGKPIGFCLSGVLMKKLGLAEMPASMTMIRLLGLGFMAGIGFTVSLFMTSLSFNDEGLINSSKLFILIGSCLSAVVGVSLLAVTSPKTEEAT